MMSKRKLGGVIVANTLRSPKHFVLSVFGIVIGIAAFVFFLSLSLGVRNIILGKIFPLDRVEVRAPRASLLGVDMSRKIDDKVVATIEARKEVSEVVPRMTVIFPAAGYGWFDGQKINFEVGGFCDGIDPSYVRDERYSSLFHDWESPAEKAKQTACLPNNKCPDPARYYCDRRRPVVNPRGDNKCHHRVPVLISNTLLELYNAQFAKSHGLPQIGAFEKFVAQRGGLSRMRFYMALGDTMVVGSNSHIDKNKRRLVEALMVGISDKSMPIGMTIPIQYVRRWNRDFVGEQAAGTYSSIIVRLKNKGDVTPFAAWVEDPKGLNLRLEDQLGRQFATAIFIVTMLFILISLVIVTISAINIAHNFFMQVSERRREIGVLRAVGATRANIRYIVMGESALIGIVGGAIGIGFARGAAFLIDLASRLWLPSFPFKPTTYFDFQWWILLGGLLFATLFCVVGGFLPARKASNMEPAQALAAQ